MMAGEGPDALRRWKIIAMTNAFVAVAAVAGLIGWVARGSDRSDGVATAPVATFTGGGWTLTNQCEGVRSERLSIGMPIKIVDSTGAELAAGKIMRDPLNFDGTCRQEFIIDNIPAGRGVYLLEVGHRRHAVAEAKLRDNEAELPLVL
ncbi:MAG: hypothetical protein HOV71_01480 [Hamadaea sp.]|nr:hypothetical protein [Hamadaea sp.]NUR46782.1 hypothetical protein [Hamadaea sp.]NUT06013.1 hypothetical protein [Hamadaea sp.]